MHLGCAYYHPPVDADSIFHDVCPPLSPVEVVDPEACSFFPPEPGIGQKTDKVGILGFRGQFLNLSMRQVGTGTTGLPRDLNPRSRIRGNPSSAASWRMPESTPNSGIRSLGYGARKERLPRI